MIIIIQDLVEGLWTETTLGLFIVLSPFSKLDTDVIRVPMVQLVCSI